MSDRWLIVGLGNPGKDYQDTRHNIGFKVIDEIWRLTSSSSNMKTDAAYKSELGLTMLAGEKLIVAKPLTFMNDSGWAVEQIAKWYGVSQEKIVIVYDDISLDFGRQRYRAKGSAGGHNGIKSIIAHLNGSQDFHRLKVGIGPKPNDCEDLINYVLGNFDSAQEEKLPEIVKEAVYGIETIITSSSAEIAMTKINGK